MKQTISHVYSLSADDLLKSVVQFVHEKRTIGRYYSKFNSLYKTVTH